MITIGLQDIELPTSYTFNEFKEFIYETSSGRISANI